MSNYSQNQFTKDENHAWSILYEMIPANSMVLDIGSSSGNFGKVLIDGKKCVVDGIELDEKDSQEAKKVLRKVWNLDIEQDDLKIIPDQYDIVILADVIEHLVHPAKALIRIKKLLKPGGSVVFSIPNMAHVSVRLDLLAGNFDYTETGLLDKTHLHYYDSDEVYRVFKDAGMTIEKIDYPQIRYPKELIDKKLESLGLQPSETFYRQLDKPEYNAYQFIGKAKYLNKAPAKPAKLARKQAVQNDYMMLVKEIDDRKQLELQLSQELKTARAEINNLSTQLKNIVNSKSFKLARKMAKTASYAKPRKK